MARIVFTWELGAGYGHLLPHLHLAQALLRAGHQLSFLVRELDCAEAALAGTDIRYLQAPRNVANGDDPIEFPATYAEMLYNLGYHNATVLTAMTRAWCETYRLLQPDLLVCDHSPTALLAAHADGRRAIAVGQAFVVPPDLSPLPSLRAGDGHHPARDLHHETCVTAHINLVLKHLGAAPLRRIGTLFAPHATLLLTYPELDCYPRPSRTRYWGAVAGSQGAAPEWPRAPGPRIFAYLKPFETLPALLESLQQQQARSLVFGPQLPASLRRQYTAPNMRFVSKRQDMAQVAAQADLAICHGGHGTLTDFLTAGVPLLTVPLTLEQHLLGERLAEVGAGLNAPLRRPTGMAAKLQRLLADPSYRVAAQRFAADHPAPQPLRWASDVAGQLCSHLDKRCS